MYCVFYVTLHVLKFKAIKPGIDKPEKKTPVRAFSRYWF